MAVGGLAGGFCFQPLEVLKALRQALRDGNLWKGALATLGVVVALAACMGSFLVNVWLGRQALTLLPVLLGTMAEPILAALVMVPMMASSHIVEGILGPAQWIRWSKRDRAPWTIAGIMLFSIFVLPLLLTLFITRVVPAIWRVTPQVTLRFVELIATHERLAVMGSAALGTFVGRAYDHVLIGGLSALLIGALVILVSKVALKKGLLASA